MSDGFDPYQAWLGVTSATRPPNHYELLGLRAFESDAGGISGAFERQKARLAAMASGHQKTLAERILRELAEARLTLTTPSAKQAYDTRLRSGAGRPRSHQPRPDAAEALLPPMAVPTPRPQPPAVPMATLISPPGWAPAVRPPPAPIAAPVSPPAVTPAYPPYGPAFAPGAAPQPVQPQLAAEMPFVSTARSSVNSYLHRPRRKWSSTASAAIGLAVAAILAAAAAYIMQADRLGQLAQGPDAQTGNDPPQDLKSADQPPPARVATRAPRAGNPHVGQTAQRRSQAERGSRRPPRTVDGGGRQRAAIAAIPRVSSTDQSPSMGDPLMANDASGDSDNPKNVDSMPVIDGDMPTGTDAPDDSVDTAERAPPSPQIEAAVKRNLAVARAALARRDVAAAEEQLNLAMLDVETAELEAEIDRVFLLSGHVAGFWQAVGKSLAKLEAAEELELNGQIVSVVESDNQSLVVRAGGRNRTYTLEKLPVPLALLLAQRSLPKDDPKSKAALGAFHAVDARGDVTEARRLWQEAAGQGLDLAPLLSELDSRPE